MRTEITCHGRGAAFLADGNVTVIDIGGQDTKVIVLHNGKVLDFVMNDKCSAGTGKFLEIMANRLGLSLSEMFDYAAKGKKDFFHVYGVCRKRSDFSDGKGYPT